MNLSQLMNGNATSGNAAPASQNGGRKHRKHRKSARKSGGRRHRKSARKSARKHRKSRKH